jgi:hypothetical protein
MSYRLWVGLLVMGYELWVMDYGLWVLGHLYLKIKLLMKSSIAHNLYLITHISYPITHNP